MDLYAFWSATLKQDAQAMSTFFDSEAVVKWHNTNELFTVEEFIRANCEYPGSWDGEVERVERIGDLYISVTHVFSADRQLSFHVTSFIKLKKDKVLSIDEYWGDDGLPPQWRLDKKIGRPIR